MGQPQRGIKTLNEKLQVADAGHQPDDLDKERVLLLLERATLLQALGEYQKSANDLVIVDQRMDYLDIDAYGRVEFGKWLYSGDAEKYEAPAFERLLLNIVNMINFLALKDLSGARVEARRFHLLADHLFNNVSEPIRKDIMALGYYLGGFAFEKSHELDDATRFYSHAFTYDFQDPGLKARLIDLMRATGSFRALVDDKRLTELTKSARSEGTLPQKEYHEIYDHNDVILITQIGLVPYKVAEYLPFGAGLAIAMTANAAFRPSPDELTQADVLMSRGALSTLNVPKLVVHDVPYNPAVSVRVDSAVLQPIHEVNLTDQVEATWLFQQPMIISSAITRSITRAVAGEVTNQVAGGASNSVGVGALAGLAVQGAMIAADQPDTRSWLTLPSFMRLYRLKLSPQTHTLTFSAGEGDESRTIAPARYHLLNFSKFRQ